MSAWSQLLQQRPAWLRWPTNTNTPQHAARVVRALDDDDPGVRAAALDKVERLLARVCGQDPNVYLADTRAEAGGYAFVLAPPALKYEPQLAAEVASLGPLFSLSKERAAVASGSDNALTSVMTVRRETLVVRRAGALPYARPLWQTAARVLGYVLVILALLWLLLHLSAYWEERDAKLSDAVTTL
jgi:hypothetical protein